MKINLIIFSILILIFYHFFLYYFDKYYKNKSQKRWANICRKGRDDYRKKYGNSPPGWEWETLNINKWLQQNKLK